MYAAPHARIVPFPGALKAYCYRLTTSAMRSGGSIRGPVCFDHLNIGRASRHGEVRRNPYTRIMTSPPASATVFSAAPAQAIQVSALGASENLLSAVKYCLQVLELLTATVTALPYRVFLRLEWFRLDWVLCRPCHAKHR